MMRRRWHNTFASETNVIPDESMETELQEILWQALRGGDYDLDEMKRTIRSDARFEDLGIDSLDMTAFFVQIEDRYRVKIRQEEYPSLDSIGRVQSFLETRPQSEPAT
jgi:acyl carrier protein